MLYAQFEARGQLFKSDAWHMDYVSLMARVVSIVLGWQYLVAAADSMTQIRDQSCNSEFIFGNRVPTNTPLTKKR